MGEGVRKMGVRRRGCCREGCASICTVGVGASRPNNRDRDTDLTSAPVYQSPGLDRDEGPSGEFFEGKVR